MGREDACAAALLEIPHGLAVCHPAPTRRCGRRSVHSKMYGKRYAFAHSPELTQRTRSTRLRAVAESGNRF